MTVTTRPVPPPTIPARDPRPDLQGLRALAAGAVVATHLGAPAALEIIGVTLLVLTSVFVTSTRRHRLEHGFPALALVLAATLTVSFLLGSPLGAEDRSWGTTKAALLLVAGLGALALVPRAPLPGRLPHLKPLARSPLTWLGERAYSIYLWQWAAALIVADVTEAAWAGPAAALVALVAAYLTHRYLSPATSLVTAATLTAALVALAVAPAIVLPALIPNLGQYRADERTKTFAEARGCLVTARDYHPDDIERCTVRVPRAKGWILLIGDDHTASFSTAVVEAARELDHDTVSLQGTDCPCGELTRDLLDRALGANPPALVVTTAGATDAATDAALGELKASGVPNLRLKDVPHFGTSGSACRGGLLTFTCTHNGHSALVGGHLAYADAQHLNGLGSRARTASVKGSMSTTLATE